MKNELRKYLAIILGVMVFFSGMGPTSVVMAENGASASEVIDLSHDNPNAWGAGVGIKGDAEGRWQSFTTPDKNGLTIESAEVYLTKKNPSDKLSDITVSLYKMKDGLPNEALVATTIEKSNVVDKGITKAILSSPLEGNTTYAIVVKAVDPQLEDGGQGPCYNWVSKNIGKDDTNPSGKVRPSGMVDETQYIHTLWTKINLKIDGTQVVINKDALVALIETSNTKVENEYTTDSWSNFQTALNEAKVIKDKEDATQEEVDNAKTNLQTALNNLEAVEEIIIIDLSHDNPNAWGAGVGIKGDAEGRWQSFTTPDKNGLKIESAEVYLTKKNPSDKLSDIIVSLYKMKDGLPSESLVATTIVKSNVVDKGITKAILSSPLEGNTTYAIVVKAVDPQPEDGGQGPCYNWVSKNIGKDDTNPSGKVHPSGMVDETQYIHTLWTKINLKIDETQVVVNKEALKALIETSNTKVESEYTADSWSSFQTVLNEAKVIKDKADATQEEVDNAKINLQTALNNLEAVEEINVIDLSHESPKPYGASFGIESDAQARWQTFTAIKDGKLDAIEAYLIKINPDKEGLPTEVIATIYEAEVNGEEVSLNSALQSTTVSSDTIHSNDITRFEFDVELIKDKKYAFALTTNPLGKQSNDHARYDWANKDIGKDATHPSGKTMSGSNVVNETQWVHTYWTKIYYEKELSQPIDYTFEGHQTSGFSFGVTNETSRWQTFTSNVTDRMSSFEVYLIKKNQCALTFPNVIATLYEVENNVPSNVLKSVTKPSGEIETNGIATINLQYDLIKGKQYAIGLSTDDIQAEEASVAKCYDWPTSDKGLDGIEFFGKVTGNNFIYEPQCKTGYLKVNFGQESGPVVPKPTTMDLTTDKTILAIDETTTIAVTVKDQFGNLFTNGNITFESSDNSVATVDDNGKVTAHGGGISKITATCGDISEFITVTVKDGDGLLIPVPGMIINEDTKFKPGEYDFGGASKGIEIKGDNITLDGSGVTIFNAPKEDILEDVTTGAYAYTLNAVDGKKAYNMVRHFDFTKSNNITFSFDAKAANFTGELKVSVSEDKSSWTDIVNKTDISTDWSKYSVDLNAYAGKKVYVRLSYTNSSSSTQEMNNMGLKIDTIELVEDTVRTFSDLAEAKVFYLWELSYDDGVVVADTLENKPFDRTIYDVNTSLFKGTAISINDSNGVTIKGFTISGFYYALEANNCDALEITNNNFSNNYTDPNGGWGDQDGGAVRLHHVNNSKIIDNIATNTANGLSLRYSNNNTITGNNFSVCSDVALELWSASYNTIIDNDFSWGIRIDPLDEVHARDSTSSLIEAGSNFNYIKKNDFTHGGDGIFIRALNGYVSEGNVFEENDTSFANNNAVESGMGRNYYIRNKANYSSYGFWLGGSDESTLIGNEIAYNGIKPANAPEVFGNAGISMKGWSSEHMVIVDNDIHDNNGSGIAMTYKEGQPSYHALIQNNRIANNTKYPIYLDRAEWFEINGNLVEGNGNNNELYTTSNAKDIITREGATYQENYSDYLKEVPSAIITDNMDRYETGKEIVFSASDSTDPGNKPLTYRWDMGDGTILTGETVKYTYKQPGFYDVAVTATNGTWSDIDWNNINVVASGSEMGTEDNASNWDVTSNDGKTVLVNDVPHMTIPQVGNTLLVDYPIYYVIDGQKSIKMTTTAATNALTYPKTKDGGYDFSNDAALTFSMKIRNQNRDDSRTPIVTLYTDDNNYMTYTPTESILSPFNYVNFTQMQYRHEWYAAVIPFEGNSQWVKSVNGSPDLENINYITLKTVTGGTLGLDLWIDGLKTISKDTLPYYGSNIASDGVVVTSSTKEGSDEMAPIADSISPSNKWVSEVEGNSSYGVTFNSPRNINQIDFYVYFKPTGLQTDTIGLPSGYTVQYMKDGQWISVSGVEGATGVMPDANIVKFNRVAAEGIRILFDNAIDKAVALYGFKALNTENSVAERNAEGKLVTDIISSVSTDAVLDSIDMFICINNETVWPQEYTDFKVYLYHISEDGKGPTGSPLASGTLPIVDIVNGGLNKSYNIVMRGPDNNKVTLKSGERYVIGATQQEVKSGAPHYRWPTSKSTGVVGEDFGKYTFDRTTEIVKSIGNESNLGTGWLRVHTDQDKADQSTIDFSFALNHSTGYGVGHVGEDCRYQTFTMTRDKVLAVADGAVNNGDVWKAVGVNATNTLTMVFNEDKKIHEMGIYLDTLPEKLVVKVNNSAVVTKTNAELAVGLNLINNSELGELTTKNVVFEFLNGEEDTTVKEIEVIASKAEQSYTVTFDANGGSTVAAKTVKKNTIINEVEQPTRSGYQFMGWYNGSTKIQFPLMVTQDITLKAHWRYIYSDTSTDSSDDTQAEKEPVKPKVNISVKDNQKEGQSDIVSDITYTPEIMSGVATANIEMDTVNILIAQVKNAQKKAENSGSTIDNSLIKIITELPKGGQASDVKTSKTKIPKEAVKDITDNTGASVQIETPVAKMAFDKAALESISNNAKGNHIEISAKVVNKTRLSKEVQKIVGDKPVYDFTVSSNSKNITSFEEGKVTVSIPYTLKAGEDLEQIVIHYINDDGELEVMKQCIYDEETQTVRFTTNHFSKYAVAYKPIKFQDVTTHSKKDDIHFVTAREVFLGVGDNMFAPDAPMTRGMFVTVLGRIADINVSKYSASTFSDVDKGAWYGAYVTWAYDNKILSGVGNNKFAPNESITYEQMCVIIHNYIKHIGLEFTATEMKTTASANLSAISHWAKEAVEELQKTGIVEGISNNAFDPQGLVTRGEVSSVFTKLIKMIIQ